MDIGLSQDYREMMGKELSVFLAESYALMVKSHNYHWNVKSPNFKELHSLFQEHYEDLFEAVDDVAERIQILDVVAPGSFGVFKELSTLSEETGVPAPMVMVKNLLADHEALARRARDVIGKAEEGKDTGTADLITERLRAHEKTAWMLRSML